MAYKQYYLMENDDFKYGPFKTKAKLIKSIPIGENDLVPVEVVHRFINGKEHKTIRQVEFYEGFVYDCFK